jgi:co-chaperonin GroES (HSP10)
VPEIKIDPQSNVVQLGAMTLEAHSDRLIILQDDFRSGYECARCAKTGSIVCENCHGTGASIVVKNGKCSACEGRCVQVCPDCKGQGASIHVPENAERRPTTGTIVSVGPKVTNFWRGDSVIYPSFSGHAFDLSATDIHGNEVVAVIVILRDEDVLAKVSGHLEFRRVRKSAALGTAA